MPITSGNHVSSSLEAAPARLTVEAHDLHTMCQRLDITLLTLAQEQVMAYDERAINVQMEAIATLLADSHSDVMEEAQAC